MSLRLPLPLILACAAGGHEAGGLAPSWCGDRCAAAPVALLAAPARAALAHTRAAQPAERAARRRAFRERFPRSWGRAGWERAP